MIDMDIQSIPSFHDKVHDLRRGKEEEIVKENLNYVIYARKSTDEQGKQVSSIEDQIEACVKYAQEKGLKVLGTPLVEKESAKISGHRPVFTRMLQDIRAGKYDGILSWHPDRLARNMKEAGEIIDMVDHFVIKDLAFVSFMFENSPSGKLLLGISFSISKEYSDKLAINVKRGMVSKLTKGQWVGDVKLGYYKDRNQMLCPEDDFGSFKLMKEAWQMRLKGVALTDIANYLNENNFKKATRHYFDRENLSERMTLYKTTKQKLSGVFADPFYVGEACFGETVINLRDISGYNFIPMVSEEEFLQLNPLFADKKKYLQWSLRGASMEKASLLHKSVICGHCGEPMGRDVGSKAIRGGSTRWYYRFRCDTKGCRFAGKTIRAKVIKDFVQEFLDSNPFDTPELYERYKQEVVVSNKKKVEEVTALIKGLESDVARAHKDIDKIDEGIRNNPDNPELASYYLKSLGEEKDKIKAIEQRLQKERVRRESLKKEVITYEKYLELVRNISDRFAKIKSLGELDWSIKKIFSNFTIKDKKVLMYTLQTPFKEFAEQGLILKSASARIRT